MFYPEPCKYCEGIGMAKKGFLSGILRGLGRRKYKFVRVIAYVQLVNLAILVQVNGWQVWYLLIPPLFLLMYWFEVKYGIPGEQDVGFNGNENFKEMKRKIDKIYDALPKE